MVLDSAKEITNCSWNWSYFMGSAPCQRWKLEGYHCGKWHKNQYWCYLGLHGLPPIGYLLSGVWHFVFGKIFWFMFVFLGKKKWKCCCSWSSKVRPRVLYFLLFVFGPIFLPEWLQLVRKMPRLCYFQFGFEIYWSLSKKKKKTFCTWENHLEWLHFFINMDHPFFKWTFSFRGLSFLVFLLIHISILNSVTLILWTWFLLTA